MDPNLKMKVEIETTHELLPDLDYYQILEIKHDIAQSEIDSAFRTVSRRLHPDRFSRLDSVLREKANDIYRLANEAHKILRDPDKRALFDNQRIDGAKRFVESSEKKQVQTQGEEAGAKTPLGEKYWKLAMKCWSDKDYKGCMMQLKFAMQFEPNNDVFKQWVEKVNRTMSEGPAEENPYKLRIV